MGVDKKIEYLKERVKKDLDYVKKKRSDKRVKAITAKMLVTFFSILTTILLGLQGFGGTTAPVIIKNAALVLSALVTLVSTWDAFFNHRAIWIRLQITVSQLYQLQYRLEYLVAEGTQDIKPTDIDNLYDRYQSIWEEANLSWLEQRKDIGSGKAG